VFETLLASHTIGAPWPRTTMAALLFHVLLIAAAVSSTGSPDAGTRAVARDTIRLAITEQATPPPPKSSASPRSRPEALIPDTPRLPDRRLDAPEFQPPPLSFSPLAAPQSTGNLLYRNSEESPVARDSSRPVFSATEVDELPELTGELHLPYPDEMRRAGVSGLVVVQYVVGSDGRVDRRTVRVLASSHHAFVLAALQALRDGRFRPARRGGRPVAVLVQQTIRFRCR
jgi:protein TonB